MKNPETISLRTGWIAAGAYNSAMVALSAGAYMHEVRDAAVAASLEVAATVGLLTAAACTLLCSHDLRRRAREAQGQSAHDPQPPQLPTAETAESTT
jgi:hypothetical protein